MIKIHREKNSPQADLIEAELQDMILGYDREILKPAAAALRFGEGHPPPVITNNDRMVSGAEIPVYLEELRELMQDWQAFQGDSCYVNASGENC